MGQGYPHETLATVFELFHRSDSARSAGGGTGPGLTIARLLARGIGGSISLHNRAGGGLSASVTISLT